MCIYNHLWWPLPSRSYFSMISMTFVSSSIWLWYKFPVKVHLVQKTSDFGPTYLKAPSVRHNTTPLYGNAFWRYWQKWVCVLPFSDLDLWPSKPKIKSPVAIATRNSHTKNQDNLSKMMVARLLTNERGAKTMNSLLEVIKYGFKFETVCFFTWEKYNRFLRPGLQYWPFSHRLV